MNDPDTPAETPVDLTSTVEPPESPVDESPADQVSAEMPPSAPTLPDPVPHAGARYALLRLLMLVAVGGILYVIGMRGWLLAFAAVLVSGIASLFLFMKQRNDAAVNLEHAVDDWKHGHGHGRESADLAAE
jgi:Protein of unknown function (DUF4229)